MTIKIKQEKILIPRTKECHNFITWFDQAKFGDKLIYYRSDYLYTKYEGTLVGELVWRYACDGKLLLFQKRIDVGDYEYICFKVNNPSRYLIPGKSAYAPKEGIKRRSRVSKERASINGTA